MVENDKEYVLQWTGHAAHVTERFSGLLARQALVDVTLICQGQKLRVHKLVLASSSLYFEEMLEQDLGQEPIILLRDLHFEVLKAMVEFMYCGETTISNCHFQALLDAAQVFKVKELKCIVESMMKSEKNNEKMSVNSTDSCQISNSLDVKRNGYKSRSSSDRCDEKSEHESEIPEITNDHKTETNSRLCYINDDDSLYETPEVNDDNSSDLQNADDSLDEISLVSFESSEASKMSTSDEDVETSPNHKIATSTHPKISKKSPKNYEDSQDPPRAVGECSRVYTHKKRTFPQNEKYSNLNGPGKTENSQIDENKLKNCQVRGRKMEKCLKVYTHKRRKSLNDKKSIFPVNIRDSMEEPTSTSCIDLSDDNSRNEQPITLQTNLDMETSDYIWNLSTESIQYVVGCTINSKNLIPNDPQTSEKPTSGLNRESAIKTSRRMNELFPLDRENEESTETPVLRRSVRINQLENDDSLNNNNRGVTKLREKSSEIDFVTNDTVTSTKTRRRVRKDSECRITDENIGTTSNHLQKNVNSRSLRSGSKIASRRTKNTGESSRDERQKNSKLGQDKRDKMDSEDIFSTTRLNTIASVDRALWGDMADVLENRENSPNEFSNDYSPSREIPFAVGLLPLRAALERMQATLDHQPRKTRSSVATPLKPEVNGFRRKFSTNEAEPFSGTNKRQNCREHFSGTNKRQNGVEFFSDTNKQQNGRENFSGTTKQQNGVEDEIEERAFCRIQVRTSCEEMKKLENSNDERIINVGSSDCHNEQ